LIFPEEGTVSTAFSVGPRRDSLKEGRLDGRDKPEPRRKHNIKMADENEYKMEPELTNWIGLIQGRIEWRFLK
jgi:hypothetical protein